MFDLRKRLVLARYDKSKKGSLDQAVRPLVDLFNRKKDFYTTSSCAGRIVIMVEPATGRKKDTEWLYVTHEKARLNDVMKSLKNIPDEILWLRMEPFIMHVCARTPEDADKLMKILTKSGLKHSGILHIGKRVIIEIIGNERMDVPISEHQRLLVDRDYIKFLVRMANKKLLKTRNRIKTLFTNLELF